MTKRFGKKWLVFIFVLLSLVVLWALGAYLEYVTNNDILDRLASRHDAITSEEWRRLSVEEVAGALKEGKFEPDKLTFGKAKIPAISIAAGNLQEKHVRLLLDYGAQVDLPDSFLGASALHFATFRGHAGIVKILLEHGANPNFRDKRGESPLLYLNTYIDIKKPTDEHLKKIILLLVDNGADINATNNDGQGLIDGMIFGCRTELIEFFVHKGLDVNNHSPNSPLTPLDAAIMIYPEAMQVLLKNGADLHHAPPMVTSLGLPLLPVIYADFHASLVGNTPLQKAVIFSTNPTVAIQILLDANVNVNQYVQGTALQYAKERVDGNASLYEVHTRTAEKIETEWSQSCAFAEGQVYAQGLEEWQQKGQEAVDMLLAHGADDGKAFSSDLKLKLDAIRAELAANPSLKLKLDAIRAEPAANPSIISNQDNGGE